MFEINGFDEKKKRAEYWWNRHKFDFVVITKKDNSEATGILIEITEINDLHVKFKGQHWYIDPLDIKHVFAKPDRFLNSDEGGSNR